MEKLRHFAFGISIVITVTVVLVVGLGAVIRLSAQEFPRGTWESENPNIILHINQDYQTREMDRLFRTIYPAIYRNDEELKIFVEFATERTQSMISWHRPRQFVNIYSMQNGVRSPFGQNDFEVRGASVRVVRGRLRVSVPGGDLIFNPIEEASLSPADLSEWRYLLGQH